MLKTTTILSCDFCLLEITDKTPAGSGKFQEKDICSTCLTRFYKELEPEYHRVILGEVPARRGGYRRLGDPSDT